MHIVQFKNYEGPLKVGSLGQKLFVKAFNSRKRHPIFLQGVMVATEGNSVYSEQKHY